MYREEKSKINQNMYEGIMQSLHYILQKCDSANACE